MAMVVLALACYVSQRQSSRKHVCVKASPVGERGVFANKSFEVGEVIEECPTLRAHQDSWGDALSDYVFASPFDENENVMGLGHCSLYNHQDEPNATYTLDKDAGTGVSRDLTMTITATRKINKGDEIFVSYGSDWWKERGVKPN